jgi:hypothetical protein
MKMGIIEDNVENYFDNFKEHKNLPRLIMDLIWYVDGFRYAWQVSHACECIDKKLKESFQ